MSKWVILVKYAWHFVLLIFTKKNLCRSTKDGPKAAAPSTLFESNGKKRKIDLTSQDPKDNLYNDQGPERYVYVHKKETLFKVYFAEKSFLQSYVEALYKKYVLFLSSMYVLRAIRFWIHTYLFFLNLIHVVCCLSIKYNFLLHGYPGYPSQIAAFELNINRFKVIISISGNNEQSELKRRQHDF